MNITARQRRNRYFTRYRKIAMVLVKHRLGEVIRTFGLERFLPFYFVYLRYPSQKNTYTAPQRLRMAIEGLGTTFIKMGQILSTRTDVLPSDYTQELTKLQDSLKPFPVEEIEKVISDELHRPTIELFSSFDPNPLGVASIGQVHAATLRDGTEVVVKVHKPDVAAQVTEDLEILRQLAVSTAKSNKGLQQYDLAILIEEIADSLMGELDYIREGHSAEHFAQLFQDDPSIHIPKIIWEYTTPRVITMERIRGTNILDVPALKKAGFDTKELAKRSVNIWVKMVFEDTVFHADPHPGNLFVEADGRLGLIDFGMIGLVDDEVRDRLMSLIKGILDRDVDLFIDSLMDLGAIVDMSSRNNLRRDLKHVMGHYPPSAAELHLAYNLGELFALVRNNHVQLPANIFFLLKTITMAQGIGRGLDPDFDLFTFLQPQVESTIKARFAPSVILRRIPSAAAQLAIFGVGLPRRLDRIVKSVERGELLIRADVSGLDQYFRNLERLVKTMVIGIIVAAVILSLAITGYLGYLLRLFLPQP